MSSSLRVQRLGLLQLERKGHMVDKRVRVVEDKEVTWAGMAR